MAKKNEWDEHTKVPEFLQKGAYFQLCQDTFTSSTQPLQKCLIQLDEYGFYVRWRSQDQEAQLLDCNQIREICNRGYQIKDQKTYGLLAGEVKNGNVADRIIILVCGADMVNWSTFLLLAEDAETAQKWIVELRRIIHKPLHHNISFTTALKKHWMKLCFMANRDMKIPVKSITRPFSAGKNPKLAVQILKSLELANSKNDVVGVKDFTFEKFYHLYQAVCIRADVEKVFCTLAKGDFVEAEPLAQWMNEHQRDPRLNEILFPMYDHKRTRALIKNFEPVPELAKKGQLSLEGFSRYLSSLENSPVFRKRLTVFEDMDQPLCHYSINSSHNTYLNGRQFIGDSSVEMYRQVLLSGCRCIELDCWDGKGENQGEPIITHGKAMCTDINFTDVIHAINETAFVTSDYPVILSFENHCSKPQQLKLAQYCEEVFGEKLLKKPLDEYPLGPGVPLPSPSSLRRKIVIKNKRLKPEMEKVQLERYYRHSEILEEDEDEENHESREEAHPELRILKFDASRILSEDPSQVADITGSGGSNIGIELSTCIVEDPTGSANGLTIVKSDLPKRNGSVRKEAMHGNKKMESASEMALTKSSKSKLKKDPLLTEKDEEELLRNYKYVETSSTNIHSVLSNLINYCQSVKFQGFKSAEEQNLSYHMSSFSESTGVGLLKTNAIEFVNYNKRQLSRIYPRGNRVDSSNYMPQVFWNAGCQMVSLNFQTSDISMQLNQGRFEFNGVSGYLLKPEFMRRDDRQFDPFSESPVDGVIAAHCSIEIISGLFLSDKQIGTYVEVDMYGLPTDTIRKEHRTKLIQSNGLNPVYNSEPFVFRKIILPNLTLMRFAVHDENGKLLGQRVIPLEALQCGYRYISLRSASGQNLDPATLFCNIVIKSYVPDGLSDFVNALADPKKYLSIADARASQMRNMGIDEDDLSDAGKSNGKNDKQPKLSHKSASDVAKRITPSLRTVGSDPSFSSIMMSRALGDSDKYSHVTHRQYLPSTGGLAQQNSVKDLMQITPVTVEMLAKDPVYQKLAASQTKEIQRLQGKLQKERQTLERKHKEKLFNLIMRLDNGDNVPANSLCCFAPKLRNYINTEEDFKERLNSLSQPDQDRVLAMQKAQKDLETDLMNSYSGTLARMSEHHQQHQIDALKHILESTHNEALKKLKAAQEKEMADLTQHQTKSSLLSTRGISLDKSIKRAEKDRRVREMSSSNAKKFYEERHMMSSKHARQIEKVDNEQKAEAPTVINATKDYVDSQMKEISFSKNGKSETPTRIHVSLEKTLTELSENVFTDSKCETIAE